ncbi:MAG: nuclear transport factor 2 family protein [Actinomycetota bacterium]
MYHTAVRALLRRGIDELNRGDASMIMRMGHPDLEFSFPGRNSWSEMFRPAAPGRRRHVTHRGLDEASAFADRFVAEGLQLVVEDIVVGGPPWNTRIVVRAHDFQVAADGSDAYNNRAVLFIEVRWGKVVRWEDYEDTERVAAWDLAAAS